MFTLIQLFSVVHYFMTYKIQYELFLVVEGDVYSWSIFHNNCIYEDFPHYVLPCVLKDTL